MYLHLTCLGALKEEPSITSADDMAASSLACLCHGRGYLKMRRLPVLSPQLSSSCSSLSLQVTLVLSPGYIKAAPIASHFTWPSRIIAACPPSHSSQPLACLSLFKRAAHTLLSYFTLIPIFVPSTSFLSVSLKADVAHQQLSDVRVCSAGPKWIYILDFREAHSVVSLMDSHREL